MTPHDFALLALEAYSSPPDIGSDSSSARAIHRQTDGGLVVAFRGTDNIATWLADLNAEIALVEGLGALHAGFWGSFLEIRQPLWDLSAKGQLSITGHSEGAALAILFGAYLCLFGKPPAVIYAFEPPRVSIDDTLAKLFARHGVEVRLFQNGNDIVPLVPRVLHNWQHPAELIHIGKASEPFPNITDHLMAHVIEAANRIA